MIILINKENLFERKMIKNFEMIEYKNYKGATISLEKETWKHFEMLKESLNDEGIIIDIEDCYRTLEEQEHLFFDFVKRYGIDYASKIVAKPGTSEHHTGQALDIVIKKEKITSGLLKTKIY